eukprot:6463973-Amphidinium_carterae.1
MLLRVAHGFLFFTPKRGTCFCSRELACVSGMELASTNRPYENLTQVAAAFRLTARMPAS